MSKLSDETYLNMAVILVALSALIVQTSAHLLGALVSLPAGSLAAADSNAHDLLIGCIGFLARGAVRAPSPTGQAAA